MACAKTAINVYVNFDEYLVKLKGSISKIDKDVVDPISLFQQQISSIYVDSLNELKNISTTIVEHKRNVDKQKQKYFESCKLVLEKEAQLLATYNTKKTSDFEMNNASDAILKVKSIAENNAEQYKYELIKFNNACDELELKYKKTIEVLKSNEESRIFFLKCHFEKFSKIFEEYTISGFDFTNVTHCIILICIFRFNRE